MRSKWSSLVRAALALAFCGALFAATAQAQQIIGAGSTFVNPIMTHWVPDFQKTHSGVQINYQSIGSGGGIQQLKNGLVDFGASDVALNDEQLKTMPSEIVQVPESAGPVCITYNLEGLSKPLQLSGDALVNIYMGKITKWNDASIAKTNPGVKLPNTDIVVVHRSDGSGTTGIYTAYLSAVSSEWKSQVGSSTSVKWPAGLGGKGSEGVTGVVKQNPGSIGYVELSYALENNLPVVHMQNQAGKYVAPSAESASAAIDAFKAQLAKDVRDPIVNAPSNAPKAYPITGLTFLLVPTQSKDAAKGKMLKEFIGYVVTKGQAIAPELHYAPLPASISKLDQTLLQKVH
ncbi:MAG: phosphate ABC transporter substrate-binding protein PstS [Terriglobales bacterium]